MPDRLFHGSTTILAAVVVGLLALIAVQLFASSLLAWRTFGAGFLSSTQWDPVRDAYGALIWLQQQPWET